MPNFLERITGKGLVPASGRSLAPTAGRELAPATGRDLAPIATSATRNVRVSFDPKGKSAAADDLSPREVFATIVTARSYRPAAKATAPALTHDQADPAPQPGDNDSAHLIYGDPASQGRDLVTLVGWISSTTLDMAAPDRYWTTGDGSESLPEGYSIKHVQSHMLDRDTLVNVASRPHVRIYACSATTVKDGSPQSRHSWVIAKTQDGAIEATRKRLDLSPGHQLVSIGALPLPRHWYQGVLKTPTLVPNNTGHSMVPQTGAR